MFRRQSFVQLKEWNSKASSIAYNTHKIVQLIGTKVDLTDRREVSVEEAMHYAKSNGMMYEEVSGRTGQNVIEVQEE
jgi:hypothetical protein